MLDVIGRKQSMPTARTDGIYSHFAPFCTASDVFLLLSTVAQGSMVCHRAFC
jgi:hypothetical protein